jgi:hypothetical protein
MFYVKNVPVWERWFRAAMGMAALAAAGEFWGFGGLGIGVGLAGAMLAMTGMVGFCPMCAMAGRKLDKAR